MGGQLLNLARVKLEEERMRETGREEASNARLFAITEAEAKGPAVKHLARERDAIAWSQALFCDVLIKKTNNFPFF